MSTTTLDENRTFLRWILPQTVGLQALELDRQATLGSLGDDEVLVEMYAASLNYRDLVVAKGGVPGQVKRNLVPESDGAGIVRAVGKKVSKFSPGDRVVTHIIPYLADDAFPAMADISSGIGHSRDGPLTEWGQFHESNVVLAPKNLNFERAATLTCSGLTAWNGLFGLEGSEVQPGDWVLVQGTRGVSIAALQFAVAVGANVVATTSSEEKAARLKDLGAKHVINYRSTPAWSGEARRLTPAERGFDSIVDVGGDGTLPESLKAVRTNGIIVAAGLLSGTEPQPVPLLHVVWHACTTRGLLGGTRDQFNDMVKFVEDKDIQPVLDDVIFSLEEAKGAYQRLQDQKHFAKVVIKIR